MNRFAIFVDAGYLLRQAVEIASKRTLNKRSDLVVHDPAGFVTMIVTAARNTLSLKGKELLRVYWYDGVMATGYTKEQQAIRELPDVQFRGGSVNGKGQQKGVDALITTDLIELAGNGSIRDAAVLTGDSDLAIGIELAQKRGVRVAVIGVEDLTAGVAHSQSPEITCRADRVCRLGGPDILGFVKCRPPKERPAEARTLVANRGAEQARAVAAAAKQAEGNSARGEALRTGVERGQPAKRPDQPLSERERAEIQAIVQGFLDANRDAMLEAVDGATGRIVASMDAALIHHVYGGLDRGSLTKPERNYAREVFRRLHAELHG